MLNFTYTDFEGAQDLRDMFSDIILDKNTMNYIYQVLLKLK